MQAAVFCGEAMFLPGLQTDRYAEYPKLKELVERKDSMAKHHATPPMFLQVSPHQETCLQRKES